MVVLGPVRRQVRRRARAVGGLLRRGGVRPRDGAPARRHEEGGVPQDGRRPACYRRAASGQAGARRRQEGLLCQGPVLPPWPVP